MRIDLSCEKCVLQYVLLCVLWGLGKRMQINLSCKQDTDQGANTYPCMHIYVYICMYI